MNQEKTNTHTSNNGAIALVDDLIKKAVKSRASDIHLEPDEHNLKVRLRIDGELKEILTIHKSMHAQIVSRIKIMVGLDIAESRLPQDGRGFLKVDEKSVDLRVSTLPTINGEKAVIRLLNRESAFLPLDELGMDEASLKKYKSMVSKPNGIILVTGPTGSGKTTTLYSTLSQLKSRAKNITTIEDPVEYHLSGINQVQVNHRAGLTFAKGLRSILRQDPDIIMVGEIRDEETARIAVQAALTGHLVFSTLHTNDAPSTLIRLMDMGIENYLLNATLIGSVAQRLVKVLCPSCERRGCKECDFSGFKGRTGIYEILTMDDAVRAILRKDGDISELRVLLKKQGMKSLFENGMKKVEEKITTVEEISCATNEF